MDKKSPAKKSPSKTKKTLSEKSKDQPKAVASSSYSPPPISEGSLKTSSPKKEVTEPVKSPLSSEKKGTLPLGDVSQPTDLKQSPLGAATDKDKTTPTLSKTSSSHTSTPTPLPTTPSPFDNFNDEDEGMWGQKEVKPEKEPSVPPLVNKSKDTISNLGEKTDNLTPKKEEGTDLNLEGDRKKFPLEGEAGEKKDTPPLGSEDKGKGAEEEKEELLSAAANPPKHRSFSFLYLLAIIVLVGSTLALGWLMLGRKKTSQPSPSEKAAVSPHKSKVVLTYWGLWEPASVMKPLFDKFKAETGIEVKYIQKPARNYRLLVTNAIKDNEGPDLFRFHNTWLPMLKDDLDNAPNNVFSTEEFEKTFYPVAANDLIMDQKIKGIPLEVDGLLLFYNKDLLSKAGLLNNLPTNWDVLARQAKSLTQHDEQGKITTAGVALGTTNNVDHWSDILALMFFQNGVEMDKLDTSLDAKGHNLAVDAIRYYTHFVEGDSPVWSSDLPSSTVMFDSGQLAYYFGPSWRAFEFAKNGVNFGITNVPKIPGDNSEWASYWAIGVASTSHHKKEAWQLVKFMSQPENLRLFFDQAKKVRLFGEPYPRQDMKNELEKDEYLKPIAQMATNLRSYHFVSFTYDQGLNDRSIDYLGKVVQTALQGEEFENSLKIAADQIKQVEKNYNFTP